ncbi:MAG: thioredoxin family protein [Propionibacteriaceae bacterium]|jgi:thioredoxin-like negative regulator of GroEL|nr:thioredoxin family protein [Propionibacteriaceae bacterium]
MSLIEVDASDLDSVIASHPQLIVDFWASWCQPCLRFRPIFEAAAAEHDDVTFATFQVDADSANQERFAELELPGVPVLLLFKEGRWVELALGAQTPGALRQLVTSLRDLDLEEPPVELTGPVAV